MFRALRIAVLLTILLIVAGSQVLTEKRFASWEKPLWVTIYPVMVEPDASVRGYVQSLDAKSFQDIGVFLKQQASRYGLELETPVFVQVASPLNNPPPVLPIESSGLKVAMWSLKMRWWSWRNTGQASLTPDDIRIFVLYQKDNIDTRRERSVGVKNGSYGIVNAVATRQTAARDLIVITHELMHVLGATDKYDMTTGQPVAPSGLANPEQSPLYPQRRAEIMGARIATSTTSWRRPASLKTCVVGSQTAAEIGWLSR